MKSKLIPLRFNELLDDAPIFRRERTAHADGLALLSNLQHNAQGSHLSTFFSIQLRERRTQLNGLSSSR
jgi:hypothetical protein